MNLTYDELSHLDELTLVLANRSGKKLGQLTVDPKEVSIKPQLNSAYEIEFKIYNTDKYWNVLKDFKLVWCKEFDKWFDVSVEVTENSPENKEKFVSGISLAESELSQTNVFNLEINTELDISRTDYKPTILYDFENPSSSLLNRVLEKMPHYTIKHVDSSIANIQRTFAFDNISIYEAFTGDIATEIECLFLFDSNSNDEGGIERSLSVYDLLDYCNTCGKRGNYYASNSCTNCGSKDIKWGYGEDTGIFVTSDALANEGISYVTDVDSVKNCFRITAGDDLMTSSVININPNGSPYIWHITEDMKESMSEELVAKIDGYDNLYSHYQNDYSWNISGGIYQDYRNLVIKYQSTATDDYSLNNPIIGYSGLTDGIYKLIDFKSYLQTSMMPDASLSEITAQSELDRFISANISTMSVSDVSYISLATANSVILSYMRAFIDGRYSVKVGESSLSNRTWSGTLVVKNYYNDEDTVTSNVMHFQFNDNYENFVKQKLDAALGGGATDEISKITIEGLFGLNTPTFKLELKKYSLDSLKSFLLICQTCIDLLIEQGISDSGSWQNQTTNLYSLLYEPYYDKLVALEAEIKVREDEVAIIEGKYDLSGNQLLVGVLDLFLEQRSIIQDVLDFQAYIGFDLWKEFCSYRREDSYSNENYISDGLNNVQLLERAIEFFEIAKREIFKSAELQHTISCSLVNLFAVKEFRSLRDSFKLGNWIRVAVDDDIYRLRLMEYELDFANIGNIRVAFSDVMKVYDGVSDMQSVIKQSKSMSTSYGSVKRQASDGSNGKSILNGWVSDGLELTTVKIVNDATNQNIVQSQNGTVYREYVPIMDSYSDKQLKIINKGLYVTNDNWKTSKAGIGEFMYYDPETKKETNAFGVIADTLSANLILSERVGIYNRYNSIKMGEDGFVITADMTSVQNKNDLFVIQKKYIDDGGQTKTDKMLYVNSNGELTVNARLSADNIVTGVLKSANEKTVINLDTGEADICGALISRVIDGQYARYQSNAIVFYKASSPYSMGTIYCSPGINNFPDTMYIDTKTLQIEAQELNLVTNSNIRVSMSGINERLHWCDITSASGTIFRVLGTALNGVG